MQMYVIEFESGVYLRDYKGYADLYANGSTTADLSKARLFQNKKRAESQAVTFTGESRVREVELTITLKGE